MDRRKRKNKDERRKDMNKNRNNGSFSIWGSLSEENRKKLSDVWKLDKTVFRIDGSGFRVRRNNSKNEKS